MIQGRGSVGRVRGIRKVSALVRKASRKIGVRGAFPGKGLMPRLLDWLKMILRMFQPTETMFF